jgi:pullulanase
MGARRAICRHKPPLAWLASVGLFALAIFLATPSFALEPRWGLGQCDQENFQIILSPIATAEKIEAQGVWLNRSQIRWPAAIGPGYVKLYYSSRGRILVKKGEKISGHDGQLLLTNYYERPLPAFGSLPSLDMSRSTTYAINKNDLGRLPALHKTQLLLVYEDIKGIVIDYTATQIASALDDLYQSAVSENDLGVSISDSGTQFKLWAPTATDVLVCVYDSASSKASQQHEMRWNNTTGVWSLASTEKLQGKYYRYLIESFVPGHGVVRNIVTDPYSISLSANSQRSYIANLDSEALKPKDWDSTVLPSKVKDQTDMLIYELHVRDFSINDESVSKANRGKYLAFTEYASNGMKHLDALSKAGLTDVHLLPVFDIATIPEKNCSTPVIKGAADSEQQQALVAQFAASDCFNWGYDPYHFNAAEGSYASDADDGAKRILEFRSMVLALHKKGLRVGMDVVFNHTSTSGQNEKSVLDRIVPGYYQRLDAKGNIERSTCCDNTATENSMMGKLMRDSVLLWAKHYKIDSFRFDLMGHQPRDAMVNLQQVVNKATGRKINLIGEGWNFGEVANGARFVQASQLSLNGTGIGTFSDRARDAVRGGHPGDSGEAMVKDQGYINGLGYDPNELNKGTNQQTELLNTADMIRVGLAGSLRDYAMLDAKDTLKTLEKFQYGDQPAGYVSQPGEVVNYVDNHDNQTLFDINAYKLPLDTSRDDRARVQILGMAINSFSQGVAYFHAGIETLRSKSMDGNSYDSGDWFNRLDWRFRDNYFATGLPPKRDNERSYAWIKPRLNHALIKPQASQIAFTRDAFLDLLKIRASSKLFRLSTAEDIKQRLTFYNVGAKQNPVVLVGHLAGVKNGELLANAEFDELIYFINVDKKSQSLVIPEERNKNYALHPVHLDAKVADKRPALQARYQSANGNFTIPARSAVVFVIKGNP